MLEVFKDLEIQGDLAALEAFLADLSSNLVSGWSRDQEREAEVNERTLPASDPHYVFQWAGGADAVAAALFLTRRHDGFEVTNIVPRELGQLTRAQYNTILDDFADRNVRPLTDRLGLAVKMTSDKLPITHWLSDEAAQRLKTFSSAANKSSGSSHPSDFKRWTAFLIQVHRDRATLGSDTLGRWLIEEDGWPETVAHKLVVEFEFARDLLGAYDTERQ